MKPPANWTRADLQRLAATLRFKVWQITGGGSAEAVNLTIGLGKLGIELSVKDGRVSVLAPPGVVTPTHWGQIRLYQMWIEALLSREQQSATWREAAQMAAAVAELETQVGAAK